MVATTSGGQPSEVPEGEAPDGYRRRRPVPAIVLLVVLAVVVVTVWVQVLTKDDTAADTTVCPPPIAETASPTIEVGAPPVPGGTTVSSDELANTPPAAPKITQVRVLNANGQRGQASLVAAQLAQLGLGPAPDMASGNDPVYTSQLLQCHGQIRFGEAGAATARTVALLAPCAELVRDARKDEVVDLALGTAFTALNSTATVSAALTALGKHAADPQSPPPDAATLQAARNVRC